jgi:site-specific recombinase XerD
MNADMRRVLGGLQKTRQESWQYVFCDASGQPLNLHHIVRPFRSAQRRAGMAKSIDFHCLRHCFASHFLMRGGSLGAGAVILGHTTTEMTDRYGHIAKNHVAYEMAKMSGPGRKVEALSPELAHDGTS